MIDPMATGTVKRRPAACAPPAGGRLFRPARPPRLTTRPGGASNNPGRREDLVPAAAKERLAFGIRPDPALA